MDDARRAGAVGADKEGERTYRQCIACREGFEVADAKTGQHVSAIEIFSVFSRKQLRRFFAISLSVQPPASVSE